MKYESLLLTQLRAVWSVKKKTRVVGGFFPTPLKEWRQQRNQVPKLVDGRSHFQWVHLHFTVWMTLNPPGSRSVVTCWLCRRLRQLAGGLLVRGERPTQDRLVLHLTPPGRGHAHGVRLSAGLCARIHIEQEIVTSSIQFLFVFNIFDSLCTKLWLYSMIVVRWRLHTVLCASPCTVTLLFVAFMSTFFF